MKSPTRKPRNIAVVWHGSIEDAETVAREIAAAIETESSGRVSAERYPLHDEAFRARLKRYTYDLVITLGGDGTMLRTGRLCAPLKVPICGVNLGSFGFMMELPKNGWREAIPALIDGKFRIETRMMIHVDVIRPTGLTISRDVLNDAVIARGLDVRPVRTVVRVNGNFLTEYVSDGLIASTATGSTAYAMAVGGPIIEPEMRTILLIPIAPHLSLNHGLILQPHDVIECTCRSRDVTVLSLDGGPSIQVAEKDKIRITASDDSAYFVRISSDGFFYRNFIQYMQRNPSAVQSRTPPA